MKALLLLTLAGVTPSAPFFPVNESTRVERGSDYATERACRSALGEAVRAADRQAPTYSRETMVAAIPGGLAFVAYFGNGWRQVRVTCEGRTLVREITEQPDTLGQGRY